MTNVFLAMGHMLARLLNVAPGTQNTMPSVRKVSQVASGERQVVAGVSLCAWLLGKTDGGMRMRMNKERKRRRREEE